MEPHMACMPPRKKKKNEKHGQKAKEHKIY